MNIIILSIKKKNIKLEFRRNNIKVCSESWIDNNDILENFFIKLEKIFKLNKLSIEDISKFEIEKKDPFGYTTIRIAETLVNSLNFDN